MDRTSRATRPEPVQIPAGWKSTDRNIQVHNTQRSEDTRYLRQRLNYDRMSERRGRLLFEHRSPQPEWIVEIGLRRRRLADGASPFEATQMARLVQVFCGQ